MTLSRSSGLLLQLLRLRDYTRHEVICGVEIDLRHPELAPRDWKTNVLWDEPPWPDPGPKLAFPWYETYAPETPAGLVDVEEGDTVRIARVQPIEIGDDFDHDHDAQFMEAYLAVNRRDGSSFEAEGAMLFVGATNLNHPGGWLPATLEKLIGRITDYFEVDSLDNIDTYGETLSEAEFAASELKTLHFILEHLILELPMIGSGRSFLGQIEMIKMVNAACSFGYYLAKAEAEPIRPYAESALRSAQASWLGGSRSGEARRRKAQQTWHPHALELARKARRDNPAASQDTVVSEIQALWRLETPKCPGSKTLKVFVSEKEHAGELPKRQGNEPLRVTK